MGWKGGEFGVYVSKIEASAKFMGMGDAMDPVMMANCLTKSEFTLIETKNLTNVTLL